MKTNNKVMKLWGEKALIPVCPEQLGGLPTPRIPQEIEDGTGEDVLAGTCKVKNKTGEDVTQQFIRGAKETLKIVRQFDIKEFIAKSNSPSCGCGRIHNGSFTGKLITGDGVTTALLKQKGIRVITAEDI